MMYGMNAHREETNGGCRNRGRSVSMAGGGGGGGKAAKSVTINEEESEE
jgi:hypothetical protein